MKNNKDLGYLVGTLTLQWLAIACFLQITFAMVDSITSMNFKEQLQHIRK